MVYFIFIDTSTTEIYTYCHTLSLHDALPICGRVLRPDHLRLAVEALHPVSTACREDEDGAATDGEPPAQGPPQLPQGQIGRAHVEIQSLMRISYAVFC